MSTAASINRPAGLVSLRPPSRTLTFYLLRELATPTLMGFGLFTFFMLMNALLELATLVIRDGIGADDVGLLLLYTVPNIIVLTVPMAVLVGGLIAFGRMSADSEVIALRSSGISLYQLSFPILLVGLAAFALNLYLCLVVLPWGNNAIIQHRWRLINTRTIAGEIRPRVFETRFPNLILWVEELGPNQRWDKLLLVRTDVNPAQVFMAQSAQFRYSPETREAWLELVEGYIYEGGNTPEESSVTSFLATERLLGRQLGFDQVSPVAKDDRTMNLGELRAEVARRQASGQSTNQYTVEIHKKFAIPAACLVMALIALPLGVSTRRHTKATGYLVAIGVIAVYYMFIDGGEKFAEEGAVPAWLGAWAGNLVIGTGALFLLWSKAREKNYGVADRILLLADGATDRVAAVWHFWRGEPSTADDALPPAGNALAKTPRRRRFPRILDRYVVSQFARIFATTLGGLVIIWMIGEYFEISDDIYSTGTSRWIMLEYFKFQLPFIIMMTIPIATILTVMVVFSLMSRQNEVVAVLAGGISLFRLAAPVLVPVLMLTVVQYAISDYIVPYSNQRVTEIKRSLNLRSSSSGIRPAQGNWVRGQGKHIFNYADYDSEQKVFQGLRIYYLDADTWRLSRIDYASRVRWVDGRWLATDSWRRHYIYSDEGGSITSPELMRMPTVELAITERPEYFATDKRLPEEMSANELRAHIASLEMRGFDASKYKIDLQQKFSFPAIVLVLALVGIPFGFRMGRQGTLSGVAVGLALTVLFWLTFVFFRAAGQAEFLPPVIAAWAPHAMFLALSGYITAGLKT